MAPSIASLAGPAAATRLGATGEFVGRQIHLSEAAFADQPSQRIVSNISQVMRREFTTKRTSALCAGGAAREDGLTRAMPCTNLRAVAGVSQSGIEAPAPRERDAYLLPLNLLLFSLSSGLHGARRSQVSSGEGSWNRILVGEAEG